MRPKQRNPIAEVYPVRKDCLLLDWENQEKDAARIMRGRRTRGSGNGNEKGDVVNSFALGEAKTTKRESFSIKMEVLCKLCREAGLKVPVFIFGFDKMPDSFPRDWFAVPAEKFDVICSVFSCLLADDLKGAKRWLKSL